MPDKNKSSLWLFLVIDDYGDTIDSYLIDPAVWLTTTLPIWPGTFAATVEKDVDLDLCAFWRRFCRPIRKTNSWFAFFYLDKQIGDLLLPSDSWIFLRSHNY